MRETTKKNKLIASIIYMMIFATVFGFTADRSFAATKRSSYERGNVTGETGWFEDCGSETWIELGGKYFYMTESDDGSVSAISTPAQSYISVVN